jgi:hypothetical protein
MRFLLKAAMSAQGGNRAVLNGTLASSMKSILEDMKPEAAYFGAEDGKRTGYFIVNVNDASEIPGLAEPLFLAFEADIDFFPVMTPQDLASASPAIERAVKKYGGK